MKYKVNNTVGLDDDNEDNIHLENIINTSYTKVLEGTIVEELIREDDETYGSGIKVNCLITINDISTNIWLDSYLLDAIN